MAKQFERIEPIHQKFIERQHIFFNASATISGHVNVSPRDGASFRVLTANSVVYLDQTGSGNETAAHLLADGRLTLMFCSFDGPPLILRLYGRGRILHRHSPEYDSLLASHFESAEPPGARQMVYLDVNLVQTSCGFGVPLFEYVGERDQLVRWAKSKGEDGLDNYRQEKNARSIDGLPTGLFEETVGV